MWFAAVANWKVEASVVQTTAHAEKMVYSAYLHAKTVTDLVIILKKLGNSRRN